MKNENNKPTPSTTEGNQSDAATCSVDYIKQAWEDHYGDPEVDSKGEWYPMVPDLFKLGFIKGAEHQKSILPNSAFGRNP